MSLFVVLGLVALGPGCKPAADDTGGSAGNSTAETGAADDAVDAALAAAALPLEKQKDIWDVEHLTFELETRFGKPFVKALQASDADDLETYLADDFEAVLRESAEPHLFVHGPVTELLLRATDGTTREVERTEFISWLIEKASAIDQIERSRLRVLKLRSTEDDPQLWQAHLLISVYGNDAPSHTMIDSEHQVVFRIQDDDHIEGQPILKSWQVLSYSRRRSQQPLMEEVTAEAGLARLPLPDNWELDHTTVQQYWSQMAVEDFDRDGYLDIAVGTYLGRPLLLRSDRGERFQDVAAQMGIRGWPLDNNRLLDLATWIDFDNDGFADLVMGDRLYHNVDGQRFEDVTAESGLSFSHNPMGGLVVDYDCDGLLDLYVLYQDPVELPPEDEPQPWVGDTMSGAENQLWKNVGGGRFRNVTATSGAGGGRRKSFAATWHFYDEDHFPDLYIANDFGNNVHLRNCGDGTFEDVSAETGMTDFATSMGVASGDFDNDGSAEFYVANMYSKMGRRIIDHLSEEDYPAGIYDQIRGSCAGNRLYRKGEDNRFQDISVASRVNGVGWAYAPAIVDLDGDGWLDTYATTGFMSFRRDKPDG